MNSNLPFADRRFLPRLDAAKPRRRYSAPLRLRGLHPVPIKADQVQICVAYSQPGHGVFRSRVQFCQEPSRGLFHRLCRVLLSLLHADQQSMETKAWRTQTTGISNP